MAIKKVYQGIIEYLEKNENQQVKNVLPHILELAEARKAGGAGSSFIKNEGGTVIAISCWYFKRWMALTGGKAVEFSPKAGTSTGFSTMCKEGSKAWTKQNNAYKKGTADLWTAIESGSVKPTEIGAKKAALEKVKAVIIPTELGFADRAGIDKYLKDAGEKVAAA